MKGAILAVRSYAEEGSTSGDVPELLLPPAFFASPPPPPEEEVVDIRQGV